MDLDCMSISQKGIVKGSKDEEEREDVAPPLLVAGVRGFEGWLSSQGSRVSLIAPSTFHLPLSFFLSSTFPTTGDTRQLAKVQVAHAQQSPGCRPH